MKLGTQIQRTGGAFSNVKKPGRRNCITTFSSNQNGCQPVLRGFPQWGGGYHIIPTLDTNVVQGAGVW